MGRRKLRSELIQDPKKRKSTMEKGKKTLKKMAYELSTLCDVPLCVIVYPMDPTSDPETYPANQDEVRGVIDRYISVPMEEKYNAKRSENLQDDNKRRKVNANYSANYPVWFPALDGFSREQLTKLASDLDLKLRSVAERIGNYNVNCNCTGISGFDPGFMGSEVYYEDTYGNCSVDGDGFDPDLFMGSLDADLEENAAFNQSKFCCDDQGDSLSSVVYVNTSFRGPNVGFEPLQMATESFDPIDCIEFCCDTDEDLMGSLNGGLAEDAAFCSDIVEFEPLQMGAIDNFEENWYPESSFLV